MVGVMKVPPGLHEEAGSKAALGATANPLTRFGLS